MLSQVELTRAAAILGARIIGHRLQGIVQPDAFSIVLKLYGPKSVEAPGRSHLLLCCSPGAARVSECEGLPPAPATPPRFAQYLRAHLGNARVGGVSILGSERQLVLRLQAREGDFDLLLSIFGKRSNLVVLDEAGHIVVTLRRLSDTRNDLSIGDSWRPPSSIAPRIGEDRFETVPDEGFLKAVEGAYASAGRDEASATLVRRLEQVLRKEKKALDRKLAKLDTELSRAGSEIGCERLGELLKSSLDKVKRGDLEIVVRDWDSGEEVTIPLDPKMSASENLSRLFKRYQKAVRTLTKAGAQQDAVATSRKEVVELAEALNDLLAATDVPDEGALEAFADAPSARSLLAKYAPAPPPVRRDVPTERVLAGRSIPAKLAPRRYRTESGLEVWVGRSDAANDYLTTRLARGADLFVHLDGAPGSHVVLRTEGRPDPPSEAVLDACELAVQFSKQRNASRADVHVVPIKNVRKPKGAKPGLVVVYGGRSLHLRRSAARLERILAARIED